MLSLQACGSAEDLASKSPAAILAASRTAAREASAVHVLSEVYDQRPDPTPKTTTSPHPAKLEIQLSGDNGRGRLVLGGNETRALRIGNALYLSGGPVFDERVERLTGKHIAPGTWVRTPAHGSTGSQLTTLTERTGALASLLSNPTISLTKGANTTVDGRKAIELKTKGKLYTGRIYIAASGSPYPLLIVKHGLENAHTTFSGWNQPAQFSAPAGAVELK